MTGKSRHPSPQDSNRAIAFHAIMFAHDITDEVERRPAKTGLHGIYDSATIRYRGR